MRPDDAELLRLSGLAHLQARRYAAAERALSAALTQGLSTAEVHYNLALSQFMQGRYASAHMEYLRNRAKAGDLRLDRATSVN
jgi:Flp pilus assembly protein TadD